MGPLPPLPLGGVFRILLALSAVGVIALLAIGGGLAWHMTAAIIQYAF